ncbi:hypothetical protein [Methylobacterium oxalidis]|uniref:hypothetical protein n=1 Tax=Methylobacterium oxalidis TaxID=944322 RepID=UPI0033155E81
MPSNTTTDGLAQGAITFRERGLAVTDGRRLSLHVCPECSQKNDARAAEKGYCNWCAYVPSPVDAVPVSGSR